MIASLRWPEIETEYRDINMFAVSPRRFANLVYTWVIARIDPEKRDEMDAELNDLLPWQDISSEAAAELESASFMAMAARGGK